MKYIICFLGLTILLSCEQKESLDFLPTDNEKDFQVFNIKAGRDTVLTGVKGSILKFKANSFQTNNGQDVQGQIELQVKEFYTVEDFIHNRLSTKTLDGRILRSSGMLFLQARSDTTVLQLKGDHPMTIMFPCVVKSTTANLFSGQKGSNEEIKWALLEPVHNDTITLRKETEKSRNGRTKVLVELEFVVGNDTIELNEENRKDFEKIIKGLPKDSVSERMRYNGIWYNPYDIDPNRFYIFKTTKLGYLNCDIFINDEVYDFAIKLNNANSDLFIVLDSLNSVLYPDSIVKATNEYLFSIPKGISISVVAYRKYDGKHYLGIERIKSSSLNLEVKQIESSLDKIREEIKKLSENTR